MSPDLSDPTREHRRAQRLRRCAQLLGQTATISLALAGLALPGCHRRTAAPGDPGAATADAAPAPRPEPRPPLSRDACFRASLAVDELLLQAGSDCASDADCDCYNGGLVLRGCRWVARRDGLAKVKRQEQDLLSRGCLPATTCPAFPCRARCLDLGAGKRCLQAGGCEALTERYSKLLELPAAGRCTDDADCALYPAGIAANCGGATDRATAAALAPVEQDFRSQRCHFAIDCAARAVGTPACGAGRCYERPGR